MVLVRTLPPIQPRGTALPKKELRYAERHFIYVR